jgi:hypothetical protein
MLRLIRDGDLETALVIWKGLDTQDQQNVFVALAAIINVLRAERGDPPEQSYRRPTGNQGALKVPKRRSSPTAPRPIRS